MPDLVLASSSKYRLQMLQTLGLPFVSQAPDIDESPKPKEAPRDLVLRLAKAKALALAPSFTNALIIGSDQVAFIDGTLLGKPHTHENAFAQLKRCSGRTVEFSTGLCLLNTATGEADALVEPFFVSFRTLSDTQIENYLYKEEPYDCAGSFKSEGLGIALFEELKGRDPNSLIGLPLIQLVTMLSRAGLDVLSQPRQTLQQ